MKISQIEPGLFQIEYWVTPETTEAVHIPAKTEEDVEHIARLAGIYDIEAAVVAGNIRKDILTKGLNLEVWDLKDAKKHFCRFCVKNRFYNEDEMILVKSLIDLVISWYSPSTICSAIDVGYVYQKFQEHLDDKGYRYKTREKYDVYLSLFLRFMESKHQIADFTPHFEKIHVRKATPEELQVVNKRPIIPWEVYQEMVEVLRFLKKAAILLDFRAKSPKRGFIWVESYYLLPLLYWTGLRISDAVNLKWKNLSETGLKTISKKTASLIELDLNHEILGGGIVLRELRSWALMEGSDAEAYIFPRMKHSYRMKATTYLRLQQLRFIISQRIPDVPAFTFHSFRNTFAVRCRDAGIELRDIAKFLAHRRDAVTLGYANSAPGAIIRGKEKPLPTAKKWWEENEYRSIY